MFALMTRRWRILKRELFTPTGRKTEGSCSAVLKSGNDVTEPHIWYHQGGSDHISFIL